MAHDGLTLETERLLLRRFDERDIEPLVAMDLDPEVRRYLGNDLWDPDELRKRAERAVHTPRDFGPLGFFAVTEKPDPAFLGWVCLKDLDGSDEIEVGYRYRQAAWGRGIATEAARAVVAHGFGPGKLDRIVAVTNRDNVASQRVLEKCGLVFERMGHYYDEDLRYYALTRDDYLR